MVIWGRCKKCGGYKPHVQPCDENYTATQGSDTFKFCNCPPEEPLPKVRFCPYCGTAIGKE